MHLEAIMIVKDMPLGGTNCLVLAKNKRKLIEIYDPVLEAEKKVCEQYGEKVSTGYTIPQVKLAEFNKEMAAINDAESEIVLEKIKVDNFDAFPNITTEQVESLMLFMEDKKI